MRWLAVVGYEELYQVSDTGLVRNRFGKIFKKKLMLNGHERICLYKNSKSKFTSVSRVVAQAFLPNPLKKKEVDHINHDITNNNVHNLRWATRAENAANTRSKGPYPKGVRRARGKGKFWAYASSDGRYIHLGTYKSLKKAADIVLKFNRKKYGQFYSP